MRSLFTKIMVWFFLNLLLLGALAFFVFNLDFRFDPRSRFFSESAQRLESISRLLSVDTIGKTRAERDEILRNYTEVYGVRFYVFDRTAQQIAGDELQLPPTVAAKLREIPPPLPDTLSSRGEKRGQNRDSRRPPPPFANRRAYFFFERTSDPTTFWTGTPFVLQDSEEDAPYRAVLVVASDSATGNGLFFDPKPWLYVAASIVLVSLLFWFPFVRRLTNRLKQMTYAAEQIADERFDVRVDAANADEIGRLGASINHLAKRLQGFVGGQKRFLGDISHELNSPLARMQFALSILETKVGADNQNHIEDVREEVELMSKLVAELLSYSETGIKSASAKLSEIALLPLVEAVVQRETARFDAKLKVEIDRNIRVFANSELLSRAVSNIVRNALRYAAHAGEIKIFAEETEKFVRLNIRDQGKGVPPEVLDKIFDPFFRVESDRARETGGTGLGLAIVKTCVEACRGRVSARTLTPNGFQVSIELPSKDTKIAEGI